MCGIVGMVTLSGLDRGAVLPRLERAIERLIEIGASSGLDKGELTGYLNSDEDVATIGLDIYPDHCRLG